MHIYADYVIIALSYLYVHVCTCRYMYKYFKMILLAAGLL